MHDLSRFHRMRETGAGPVEVYRAAKAAGLDWIECVKLLRSVFSLDLVEAKEVTVIGDGLASSLSEYQEQFLPALEQLFELQEQRDGQAVTGASSKLPANED